MNDNHYMKDMDLLTVTTYLKNLSKKLKRQEGTIPTVTAIETAVDLLSTHIPLKSCPFCGGKAEQEYKPNHGYGVYCPNCEIGTVYKDTEEQAIKAWNRRINDDQRAVNPEDG